METFMKEHISTINKNKQIHLSLGKPIYDGAFNARFNKKQIENLISNLSINHNLEVSKIKSCHVYKYQNTVTEVNEHKNKTHYSYDTDNETLLQINNISCLGIIFNILKYDDSMISICNYDNIYKTLKYTLDVNNMFKLIINNSSSRPGNEYFTVTIVISKPNDYKLLSKKIDEITRLI